MSIEVVPRASQFKRVSEVKKALKGSSDEESSVEEVYESPVPIESVYGGYGDGSIKKWDLTTGNCEQTFSKSINSILQLKLIQTSQESYLVSGD